MLLLKLWVATFISTLAFCASTVVVARMLGARVREAKVFVGPPILRFSIAGVAVHVGALPFPGGFVAFAPAEDEADPARTHFHALSRARRAAILGLPWVAIALGCIAVLGAERGLGAIGRGVSQLVLGALSPAETGAALIARLVALAETEPPWVLGALVITKVVAFNLLPLPNLAGFALPRELLRSASSRATLPAWIAGAGSLALLALGLLWAWALVAYGLAES